LLPYVFKTLEARYISKLFILVVYNSTNLARQLVFRPALLTYL